MRKLFVSLVGVLSGFIRGTVSREDLQRGIFFLPDRLEGFGLTAIRILGPSLGAEGIGKVREVLEAIRAAQHEGRAVWANPQDDPWTALSELLRANGFRDFPEPCGPGTETPAFHGFFGRVSVSEAFVLESAVQPDAE